MLPWIPIPRSSYRKYSVKKDVFKIFANSTVRQLCWSLLLIKLHKSIILWSYLAQFSAQAQKIKKNPPRENFLYPGKSNFLTLIFKIFSYFLLFVYFRKRNLKQSFSYISGIENPPKIPDVSGNGTFLYFRKWKT